MPGAKACRWSPARHDRGRRERQLCGTGPDKLSTQTMPRVRSNDSQALRRDRGLQRAAMLRVISIVNRTTANVAIRARATSTRISTELVAPPATGRSILTACVLCGKSQHDAKTEKKCTKHTGEPSRALIRGSPAAAKVGAHPTRRPPAIGASKSARCTEECVVSKSTILVRRMTGFGPIYAGICTTKIYKSVLRRPRCCRRSCAPGCGRRNPVSSSARRGGPRRSA
jgi:hypothetical protein